MFGVILAELRESKYYSISVDSTPDVSHVDLLSFCIRYVKEALPIERFLQFIPIKEHKSEYLCDIVLAFLDQFGIDLMDCRGQSYDNANNMSGQYSGLQQRILEKNTLAKFVPCAAHSTALIGKNAVSNSKAATVFFIFVENLYLFFVHSTYRWDKLKEFIAGKHEFVLKRSTGTRWSAKYNAIDALCFSFPSVLKALIFLQSDDCPQNEESKLTARSLLKKMGKFQIVFMLKLWHAILSKFNKVNITLQKADLDLSVTVKLFQSLVNYLENFKCEFDSFFNETTAWYRQHVVSDTALNGVLQKLTRTRSESASDIDKDKDWNNTFLPIVNSLLVELNARRQVYEDLFEHFHFLVKLNELNINQITTACKKVAATYERDISETELITECEMAKQYFFLNNESASSPSPSHASMYATIVRDKLNTTFPNIEILLRMFLCFFITNATDERSFSKLKYIKTYLRNSLGNHKLNALSLICIERDILDSIDFEDIICSFVSAKMRNVHIETNK